MEAILFERYINKCAEKADRPASPPTKTTNPKATDPKATLLATRFTLPSYPKMYIFPHLDR